MKPQQESEDLSGELKYIMFKNEENGYMIGSLETSEPIEGKRTTIIVGNAVGGIPSVKSVLNLKGNWVDHPKYGKQFKFSVIIEDFESDEKGQRKFLETYVDGLGPVTVSNIIDKFGSDTFHTIRNEPETLTQVEGVSSQLVDNMIVALTKYGADGEAIAVLSSYELTPNAIQKLIDKYLSANASVQKIQENPYQLIDDIDGFGFMKADKVARQLGYDQTSPFRVEAGLLHILKEGAGRGHTYLPQRKLFYGSGKYERGMLELLGSRVEESHMLGAVSELQDNRKIFIDHSEDNDNPKVGANHLYNAERTIEKTTVELVNQQHESIDPTIDESLNYDQRSAIASLFVIGKGITVITGGAGVGKTFVTQEIIKIAKQNKLTYQLLSPTGKAAKRLEEMTGELASTIHRYLKFNPHEGGFTLEAITHNILIIDEASMVDSSLMSELLKRLEPERTRLILVGDKNQLPPVGAGRPFQDIIESNFFPVFTLNKIMRTDDDSLIPINANKVLAGDHQGMDFDGTQMEWISEKEADSIPSIFVEVIEDSLKNKSKGNDEDGLLLEEIQVLSPQRKGPIGTGELNIALRARFNKDGTPLTKFNNFRTNDKVILVHNNYDAGYMNGDQGYIVGEDLSNSKRPLMLINVAGEEIEIDRDSIYDVELAYAITIHKSQGSEWKKVVMPVHPAHSFMLSRNLVYTGITRGRYNVTLIGTHFGLQTACGKSGDSGRYTWLSDLYKGYKSKDDLEDDIEKDLDEEEQIEGLDEGPEDIEPEGYE